MFQRVAGLQRVVGPEMAAKARIQVFAFMADFFAGVKDAEEIYQPAHTLAGVASETHLMPDGVERL